MARLLSWLKLSGVKDSSGAALASGKLYFYAPGTTTQTAVYGDSDQLTTLSQPVTCDAYGRAEVWTEGPVKIVAQTSAGSTVATLDRGNEQHATEVFLENAGWTGTTVEGATAAGGRMSLDAMATRIYESVGGTNGKYKDPGSSTERALVTVIGERGVSVKDFGALGNGSATDTTAIRNAIAKLKAAGGGLLIFPAGTYLVDDAITIDFAGLTMVGLGETPTIIKSTVTDKRIFDCNSSTSSLTIRNLSLQCSGTSTEAALYMSGVLTAELNELSVSGFEDGIHILGASGRIKIYGGSILTPDASGIGIIIAGSATAIRVTNVRLTEAVANTIGVSIQGSANDIMISGCVIATTTGVSIPNAGDTTTNVTLIHNNMSLVCTTAWNIVQTAACLFHPWSNNIGTATTADASSKDLASATALTLTGSHYYNITGATQIDRIVKDFRYREFPVVLKFASNPVVRHNQADSGTELGILLAGAANFSTGADDTLALIFDGAKWREVARTVI